MPVTVDWYTREQNIVVYQFVHPWTWDDYHAAAKKAWVMINNVQHIVDIILDFSSSHSIPAHAVKHFKREATHPHANRGLIIIVGANAFIRAVGKKLVKAYASMAQSLQYAATYDEAALLIEQERSRRIS
jgi:hypothetical protein